MHKMFRFLRQAEQTLLADVARGAQDLTGDADGWRRPGNVYLQNFYSSSAILPLGQSPDQLGGWLSIPHPRYNLSSWCFYGNLTDDEGNTAAISNIVQFQQFQNEMPYMAEWSYCDDHTGGYAVAPFLVGEGNVAYSSPFAITVDGNPFYGGLIALSLTSGRIGERGAGYRMTGRVVTLSGDAWEYELLLEDTLGCIQVGYGPSSFLPQYLTSEQKQQIESAFGGSVGAYLQSGRDDMFGQGSYYYSLPLLAVERFSVTRNGSHHSSGTRGNIWVDYVVQGFDASALKILGNATWQFFAIQFPEIDGHPGRRAALMVSIVTAKLPSEDTSVLPLARFWDHDGPRDENGSLQPTCEWTIDQIDYRPGERWNGFPVEVTISLRADEASVTLKATAVRDNQEVTSVKKYEGVYEVRADLSVPGIHARDVRGFGWGEVH
ncbi:MAG: hypothetical protein KY464_12155 [Gemmatimonadetes bacterium]|nr:hypothetical protein [Gemmatimonadota bacterium]